MDLNARDHLPEEIDNPPILNNNRVHPGLGRLPKAFSRRFQLRGKNQGVKRQKSLNPMAMQVAHHLGKFGKLKVCGPMSGTKFFQSKIDRVRLGRNRRDKRLAAPHGCQYLGTNIGLR